MSINASSKAKYASDPQKVNFDLDAIVESKFGGSLRNSSVNGHTNGNGSGNRVNGINGSGQSKPSADELKNPDNAVVIDENQVEEEKIDNERILRTYVELSKPSWSNIEYSSFLRYINDKGVLKAGGKLFKTTTDPTCNIIFHFHRYNYGSGKNIVWSINSKNISRLYKYIRPDKNKKVKGGDQSSNQSTNQSSNQLVSQKNNSNTNEDLLEQIGEKLLSNDNSTIINRLDSLELRTQRVEQDLKKVFLLVKRIYESKQ